MNYNFENYNSGFQLLGAAIIEQAIKDWFKIKVYLDVLDDKPIAPTCYKTAEAHREFLRKRHREKLDKIEDFFFSDWFMIISPEMDGYTVLTMVKRYYNEELHADKDRLLMLLHSIGGSKKYERVFIPPSMSQS